jgi:hypothetical protein
MVRDELRFLGPIYTFYCLTAGMAQLSCYRYPEIVDIAEENLSIMGRALEELSRRWPSAVGSLKHLYVVFPFLLSCLTTRILVLAISPEHAVQRSFIAILVDLYVDN